MNEPIPASMKPPAYEIVGYVPDLPQILSAPAANGTVDCKFVLIADPVRVWLIYGPLSDYPYHADLVSRFCRDQMIETKWRRRPDQLQIVDHNYGLHGGGLLEINPKSKTVTCSGISKAYGPFSAPILGQLLVNQRHFEPFTCRLA